MVASTNRASSPDKLGFPSFGFPEGMGKTMQAQFATALSVPQAILEANLTVGAEWLSFMGRRMKAQAELCNALSHCQEIGEAVEAHRKFSQGIASDYSTEFDQLATIMRKEMAVVTATATEAVEEAGRAGKLAA
ncbi:hypothetical protein AB4Z40_08295 [Bosea sp. 2YAB26]|uniref:hypothetical protein n=1 Tax=Bosea sp. 2YAB26 TaxID=3237478 RepID=UPI003F8EFA26